MVPISPSGGEAMDTSEDFQLELNRPSSSGLRFHLHPVCPPDLVYCLECVAAIVCKRVKLGIGTPDLTASLQPVHTITNFG